jgi:hypothetical protein
VQFGDAGPDAENRCLVGVPGQARRGRGVLDGDDARVGADQSLPLVTDPRSPAARSALSVESAGRLPTRSRSLETRGAIAASFRRESQLPVVCGRHH